MADHGHSHGHSHDVALRLEHDRSRLVVALVLIAGLLALEVAGAIVASSLALLADAGHMLGDALSLALALLAAVLATRPARGRWTFGLRRTEVLAAQVNGIALALVGVWIVYAAIRRLVSPADVSGGIVAGVAAAGVVVNLAAAALLAAPSRRSLNMRAAFLHVATDVAAFAGTAAAGVVILLTGWNRVDPIVSLLVAALILVSAGRLLRESTAVLLESAPVGIDPDAVGRAIVAEPSVVEAHDLHVWEVTSGFPALSAHVLVEPGADCHAVRRGIERMLLERFALSHTTLQVDHAGTASGSTGLGRRLGRLPAPRRS
jgi:cobalt-zinc-cadmium efflux system protein